MVGVFSALIVTSCNEHKTEKVDTNTDTTIASDAHNHQTTQNKKDSLELIACDIPEFGHVDTAHDITPLEYTTWQSTYTRNMPAPKKIILKTIKDTFQTECKGKYLMFTFSPGNMNNTDINLKMVSQHHPDSSCYSVALFRRLVQKHVLADTDTIEFVKAKRKMNENVRVIFKVTKNQNSYFYDISENPKK